MEDPKRSPDNVVEKYDRNERNPGGGPSTFVKDSNWNVCPVHGLKYLSSGKCPQC
jgi:hypothetical protein